MKKPQVKDATTGKVFAMGNSGMKGLTERVRAYAEEQRNAGAASVEVLPRTLKRGTTFQCSRCEAKFIYRDCGPENFFNTIREHGRSCAPCEILPVKL